MRADRTLTAAETAALAAILIVGGCRHREGGRPIAESFTLSVIGTNDLHGHIQALPAFGGYLANLRRARAADGGAVLLVDAGDMFQGTLESNIVEGASVVRGYAALGYAAAALGNHEFDFGPVGPAPSARGPGDDPRGALRARANEAPFPFLDANLVDVATGKPPEWANVVPDTTVDLNDTKIGIVGVLTTATPNTTLAANFAGLAVAPLASTIASAAADLRAHGATIVVAAAHAGGGCRAFDVPDDLSSCESDSEIFSVARALPPGAVDAIVAGHTHDGIAARVAGIPIVESFANGRDFGRVDLTVDRASGRVRAAHIFPPQRICAPARCAQETYEGAEVVPDPTVAAAIAPGLAAARKRREEKLGPTIGAGLARALKAESALGNWVADLMRLAEPGADVALTNGGGVRADLPPGPLTYGHLFEALPFDNRFALISITGAELADVVARNLGRDNGIVSVSGVLAEARCENGALAVSLFRAGRKHLPIADDARMTLATSDFLATGGDGLYSDELRRRAKLDDGPPIRDAIAALIRARPASVPNDPRAVFDPAHPRLAYPSPRPVRCR
jgi:2',3'-cyclic-nucleotide 2'-phosphodiesterase (5'-nucleotidase family)